jgi:hypothetical protein
MTITVRLLYCAVGILKTNLIIFFNIAPTFKMINNLSYTDYDVDREYSAPRHFFKTRGGDYGLPRVFSPLSLLCKNPYFYSTCAQESVCYITDWIVFNLTFWLPRLNIKDVFLHSTPSQSLGNTI